MKRALSWLVVVLLTLVFSGVSSFLLSLADRLLVWLQRYNETLYWVFVVLEGLAVLGFIAFAVFASASGVVAASEKICPSRKGARYIIIGVIALLLTLAELALVILSVYLGTVRGRVFPLYFVYGTWILYCICLMAVGKGAVKNA